MRTPTEAPARTPSGPTRRHVLAGGASVAALAALAGCGGVAHGAPSGAAPTGPVDLGSTGRIPVGGGTIFATGPVVVTQPDAGTFKCFSAVCTHQGCTVSEVKDGTINCPCHGSRYSITDGSVVQGPASEPLPTRPITVADGTITLE